MKGNRIGDELGMGTPNIDRHECSCTRTALCPRHRNVIPPKDRPFGGPANRSARLRAPVG